MTAARTTPRSSGILGAVSSVNSALRSYTDPTHHKWVRWLARAGYAARGLVYLLMGGLAIYAAVTWSEAIGKREALRDLVNEPFGVPLLLTLVAGMAGYIVWRLVQSIGDTDDHGTSLKGLGVRLGLLVSAGTYAFLGYYVLTLVFQGIGEGRRGAINSSRERLNALLGDEGVPWILAALFVVVAGAHLWKAWKAKYRKHFVVDGGKWNWIDPVSRTGLAARGVVLAVIGGLFAYRGWTVNDDTEMLGLGDALRFIEDLPGGAWWLGAMGAGLVLFAGYSFIEAVYRRINVHDADSPKEQMAD